MSKKNLIEKDGDKLKVQENASKKDKFLSQFCPSKLIPFKLQQLMLVYQLNHVDLKSFKSRNFSKDIQPILT